MVGRKPLPEKIHRLQRGKLYGDLRDRVENTPKQRKPMQPRCPQRLTKEQRKEWRFFALILKNYGMFTVANAPVLELLVVNMTQYKACLKQVQETGILIKSPNDFPIYNPYWTAMNKIEDKIVTQTPFWMAGDHYILSWGTANKSEPLFLFMDTGLAGGAFSFLRSVAEGKIGLHIDESSAQTAMGGGGPFTCYPMTVEEMTLGQARCTNLNGIVAENRIDLFGFPIDGIISHNFFRNYSVTFDFKNMEIIMIDK